MEDDIIGFLEYAKSQLDMAKQEMKEHPPTNAQQATAIYNGVKDIIVIAHGVKIDNMVSLGEVLKEMNL